MSFIRMIGLLSVMGLVVEPSVVLATTFSFDPAQFPAKSIFTCSEPTEDFSKLSACALESLEKVGESSQLSYFYNGSYSGDETYISSLPLYFYKGLQELRSFFENNPYAKKESLNPQQRLFIIRLSEALSRIHWESPDASEEFLKALKKSDCTQGGLTIFFENTIDVFPQQNGSFIITYPDLDCGDLRGTQNKKLTRLTATGFKPLTIEYCSRNMESSFIECNLTTPPVVSENFDFDKKSSLWRESGKSSCCSIESRYYRLEGSVFRMQKMIDYVISDEDGEEESETIIFDRDRDMKP